MSDCSVATNVIYFPAVYLISQDDLFVLNTALMQMHLIQSTFNKNKQTNKTLPVNIFQAAAV